MRLLTGAVVDRAKETDEKSRGMISVVIPALDEELLLPRCLASLEDQIDHELILVDGGSHDRTIDLAESAGALVVRSPRANRGLQMNLGARRASGQILLFLHADCRLPPGALAAVEALLRSRDDVVGGCFTMRLDSRSPLCRVASWGGDLYHRTGRPLFGDRAVFVRRDAFEDVGGFRELPIMEDVDLARRLRRLRRRSKARATGRLVMLPGPVVSSARAFERRGVLKLTVRILLACAAYDCRMPENAIALLYRH
jgi:rSAM/selenodomain-associated transferase 2